MYESSETQTPAPSFDEETISSRTVYRIALRQKELAARNEIAQAANAISAILRPYPRNLQRSILRYVRADRKLFRALSVEGRLSVSINDRMRALEDARRNEAIDKARKESRAEDPRGEVCPDELK